MSKNDSLDLGADLLALGFVAGGRELALACVGGDVFGAESFATVAAGPEAAGVAGVLGLVLGMAEIGTGSPDPAACVGGGMEVCDFASSSALSR